MILVNEEVVRNGNCSI